MWHKFVWHKPVLCIINTCVIWFSETKGWRANVTQTGRPSSGMPGQWMNSLPINVSIQFIVCFRETKIRQFFLSSKYSLAKSMKFNAIWLKNSLYYSQIDENLCDLAVVNLQSEQWQMESTWITNNTWWVNRLMSVKQIALFICQLNTLLSHSFQGCGTVVTTALEQVWQ